MPQVVAPYDSEDARGLLKASIRDDDPVVFLENELLYGEAFPVDDKVLDKDFTIPIGKSKVRGEGGESGCKCSGWPGVWGPVGGRDGKGPGGQFAVMGRVQKQCRL